MEIAILFALTIGAMLLLTSLLTDALGQVGLGLAAALAGFADAHSAAAAVAAGNVCGDRQAKAYPPAPVRITRRPQTCKWRDGGFPLCLGNAGAIVGHIQHRPALIGGKEQGDLAG